jgi:hypothetical protein
VGYGTTFENDTFMMHPYCCCQCEDCPWCLGCTCPESVFHHFVDREEVSEEAWYEFFDAETGGLESVTQAGWHARADAANARRAQRHDPECDFASPVVSPRRRAAGRESAPNF